MCLLVCDAAHVLLVKLCAGVWVGLSFWPAVLCVASPWQQAVKAALLFEGKGGIK